MPHREIVEDLTGDCRDGYCLLREILTYSKEDVPEHDVRYGHCSTGDCPLKERVLQGGLSDRMLEQMKCVEVFKWEIGCKVHRDVGWNESWRRWVSGGHAARFAEVYRDGMKHQELCSEIFGHSAVAS